MINFKNIYHSVAMAFFFAFILYLFSFSGIYPEASPALLTFFFFFLAGLWLIGMLTNRKILHWFNLSNKIIQEENYQTNLKPLLYIILFFIVELIYNRKLPLLEMLLGRQYDYRDFTFPLLHVFFTSLTSFFCIKYFFHFITYKDKKALIASICCILIFASLMYRSNIIFCIFNFILLYILYHGLNIKKVAYSILGFLSLMYIFGIAGDLRSQAQTGDNSFDVTNLMQATQASSEFQDNESFAPLYWAYLYISSPIANFQNTIDATKNHIEPDGTYKFFLYEITPDVISKRIAVSSGLPEYYSPVTRIIQFLNVATIFSDSFVFIGWFGPILLSLCIFITPIIFLNAINKGSLFYIELSICTIILTLNTFTNMLVYSTLSLQLLYPFLCQYRLKFKKR